MIYFNCDYNEGAHDNIMQALVKTNMEQTVGYGCDEHCRHAADMIRKFAKCPDADVHFLVGGTQTNETVITAALRSHQGVLAADTGHINVHETGAIEACGHKVLALPSVDGKITAKQIDDYYKAHISDASFEHIVQPKMVYISLPTELGTMYTLKELKDIYEVCKADRLYLFVDGARLGYGLSAVSNDISLPDLALNCDVFYMGGTKQGLLFGEAVVITNDALKEDFRYIIKQKGGMLAKGRLLGVMYEAALCDEKGIETDSFDDTLYMKLANHADQMADKIRACLDGLGISYLVKNDTNQIFPIFKDSMLKELGKDFALSYQERVDEEQSAVRICTSWAAKEDAVEKLCQAIERLCFLS